MKSEQLNLRTFLKKVVCPLCDGNGLIFKALLLPPNQEIYICDECDAMWFDPATIQHGYFKDFTTHVRSLGCTIKGIVLANKDYAWYAQEYLNIHY